MTELCSALLMEADMPDPDAHWRIVYTTIDGDRIVSMTHMARDRADSLVDLFVHRARYSNAKHGTFSVEDEQNDDAAGRPIG